MTAFIYKKLSGEKKEVLANLPTDHNRWVMFEDYPHKIFNPWWRKIIKALPVILEQA